MLGGLVHAPKENLNLTSLYIDGIPGHFGMIFINQMHFNIAWFTT